MISWAAVSGFGGEPEEKGAHELSRLCAIISGHRPNILNTLVLSAYRYQSIIEAMRCFVKSHE